MKITRFWMFSLLLSPKHQGDLKQNELSLQGMARSGTMCSSLLCQGLRKGRGGRMEMLKGWMDREITLQSPILSLFYPNLAPGLSKSIRMEVVWVPRGTELAKTQHFGKGKLGFLEGFWFEMWSWGGIEVREEQHWHLLSLSVPWRRGTLSVGGNLGSDYSYAKGNSELCVTGPQKVRESLVWT